MSDCLKNNRSSLLAVSVDRVRSLVGSAGSFDDLSGVWLAVLAAAGFSFKAILIKLAYAYPQPVAIDSVTLLTLRMLCAFPVFAWVAWRSRTTGERMSSGTGVAVLLLGLIGYYGASIFDFIGLQYISAGLERLILFTYPTLTLLIAALFFGGRLGRDELTALVLCYLGIALAFAHDLGIATDARSVWIGGSFVFASSLCYALYIAAGGQLMARLGSARFSSLALLVSTLATLVHFFSVHPWTSLLQPWPIYLLAAAMGIISTVIPVFALAAAIRRIGSGRAALISSLGPILTIGLGWWILAEPMSLAQFGGALLVISGVLWVGRQGRQKI